MLLESFVGLGLMGEVSLVTDEHQQHKQTGLEEKSHNSPGGPLRTVKIRRDFLEAVNTGGANELTASSLGGCSSND